MRMRFPVAAALVLFLPGAPSARGQSIDLPPRPADAPGGTEIARAVGGLDLEAREKHIFAEIARGNIPSWLRNLVPVEMRRRLDGKEHEVTFRATPDYLAVGSDDDWFLIPLSPQTAQRIANLVHASLPTPPMVDAVWAAARARLGPDSIPPGPAMTTVPVFEAHDSMVHARRARDGAPMGALVAGHKKDVVLTPRLDTLPGRVAIYGWHRPDGRPIQPLYTGHTDRWVDYSHGIRLVSRAVLIDGVEHDMLDVLRDSALAGLLSDDGPFANPAYPAREPEAPRRSPDASHRPVTGRWQSRPRAIRSASDRAFWRAQGGTAIFPEASGRDLDGRNLPCRATITERTFDTSDASTMRAPAPVQRRLR